MPEWVGNLEKFGFEPKKVCMESFDGCAPCLTSVNRSKSIFFSAEKANSVQTLIDNFAAVENASSKGCNFYLKQVKNEVF